MGNAHRSGGNMPPDLIFICHSCGKSHDQQSVKAGCSNGCARKLFRVARTGTMPLMSHPQSDPYRERDTQDDGYDFWTQGGEGTISGNALGRSRNDRSPNLEEEIRQFPDTEQSTNVQNSLPSDQDAFDASASPEPDRGSYSIPVSPALTEDESPLNPTNYTEPNHVGPHNMPHQPYNKARVESVFDRVRRKRKEM